VVKLLSSSFLEMKPASVAASLAATLFLLASIPGAYSQETKSKASQGDAAGETLRGIKAKTASAVILVPVGDKSGQGSALAEFATEVLNQSIRNGGIKTVPWFKVSKTLKGVLSGGNPYAMGGSSGSLVNDDNMSEVIISGKKLGARYILRPIIIKQSNNSEQSGGTKCIPFVGCISTEVKTTNNSEVDILVDIISIREEDIIASKTFSGRSKEVNKERANRLDGFTGMQIFSGASEMDSTKIAFYDTIDKIVEFLQDKTQ